MASQVASGPDYLNALQVEVTSYGEPFQTAHKGHMGGSGLNAFRSPAVAHVAVPESAQDLIGYDSNSDATMEQAYEDNEHDYEVEFHDSEKL